MKKKFLEGEPCTHPGCLNHVTHPCEGCGRVAGIDYRQRYFDLRILVRRLREHQNDGPQETELFSSWHAKLQQLKSLIDKELSK